MRLIRVDVEQPQPASKKKKYDNEGAVPKVNGLTYSAPTKNRDNVGRSILSKFLMQSRFPADGDKADRYRRNDKKKCWEPMGHRRA